MWAALPGVLARLAADPAVRVLRRDRRRARASAPAPTSPTCSAARPGRPDGRRPPGQPRRPGGAAGLPEADVAMIRGHCIGGGVEIAACCDLRFTDPTGVFGVTPAKVGIVYTPSSTKALIDLVGSGDDEVPAVQRRADRRGRPRCAPGWSTGWSRPTTSRPRCAASPTSWRAARRCPSGPPRRSSPRSPPAATARPRSPRWYRETVASGELAEGVAAFAERRPPRFRWAG